MSQTWNLFSTALLFVSSFDLPVYQICIISRDLFWLSCMLLEINTAKYKDRTPWWILSVCLLVYCMYSVFTVVAIPLNCMVLKCAMSGLKLFIMFHFSVVFSLNIVFIIIFSSATTSTAITTSLMGCMKCTSLIRCFTLLKIIKIIWEETVQFPIMH